MATLLVRNIDDRLVQALKARAGKHGLSAEAEHRRILEAVLLPRKKKSFAEILVAMPNVGLDSDFLRIDDNEPRNVFD
jgi:plasmid stability protein